MLNTFTASREKFDSSLNATKEHGMTLTTKNVVMLDLPVVNIKKIKIKFTFL